MYSRLFAPVLPLSSQVHAQMDRILRNAIEADEAPVARTPGINVWEKSDAVVIEAELPGLTLGDIEVTTQNRDVTISGTRKIHAPGPDTKDATWLVRERGAGSFTRTVRLPYDIDSNNARATLKDGVLTLTLPRVQPAGPRKVNIAAS